MNKKSVVFIEVQGRGCRNIATAVEEYARECGLGRMHNDPLNPDFARVSWTEFPFDEPVASQAEAREQLEARCRRPDLALAVQFGRDRWLVGTVRSN